MHMHVHTHHILTFQVHHRLSILEYSSPLLAPLPFCSQSFTPHNITSATPTTPSKPTNRPVQISWDLITTTEYQEPMDRARSPCQLSAEASSASIKYSGVYGGDGACKRAGEREDDFAPLKHQRGGGGGMQGCCMSESITEGQGKELRDLKTSPPSPVLCIFGPYLEYQENVMRFEIAGRAKPCEPEGCLNVL